MWFLQYTLYPDAVTVDAPGFVVCDRKPLLEEYVGLLRSSFNIVTLIQAIACAAAYESEWPLLVICPSSARYHWEHELLKWLDEESITKKQIMVLCTSKQELNRAVTKVVIMSYELVSTTAASM